MKNMETVYYQGEKVVEMPFIFWKETPSQIASIEDFAKENKKMICVEAGTYQEEVLRKFPSLSLKFLDKITDVLLDVKYGKSWCAAVDFSLLRIVISTHDITFAEKIFDKVFFLEEGVIVENFERSKMKSEDLNLNRFYR